MSNQTENVAYIELVASSIAVGQVSMATFAFLSYEYLITLHREIGLFWMRKKTGATWLFLATRYLITYPILNNVVYAPMSIESCTRLQKAESLSQGALYLTWAVFSALRALALSGMNWPLAIFVFVLLCAPVAGSFLVFYLGIVGEILPIAGCSATITGTDRQVILSNLVPRGCTILADVIVLAVTARYMLKNVGGRAMIQSGTSLAKILVVNGFFHFFILTAINTIEITLTILAFVNNFQSDIYISVLSDPLSALLICRFLMDLQQANQKALEPSMNDTRLSMNGEDVPDTLRFAPRMISSLGGSISLSLDLDSELYDGEADEGTMENTSVEGDADSVKA